MRLITFVFLLLPCYSIEAVSASYQNNPAGRIISGYTAQIAWYPFMAAINIKKSNGMFFCAGTLLGKKHILTAGQCVNDAQSFSIMMGSNKLVSEDPNRVTLTTSKYYLHPEFEADTLKNDIGIIELGSSITPNKVMKSIPHLTAKDISVNIQYYALGWGQPNDTDTNLSNLLQLALLYVWKNDDCKQMFGDQLKEHMMCASGRYNTGICQGDTGGPLIELLKTGYYAHVGIASFVSGNGCETTDPSGFIKTYPYVDWIRNITGFED